MGVFICSDQGVKRVIDDFEGAIDSSFLVAHSEIGPSASLSLLVSIVASGEMPGKVSAIVTSSA